ncbi:PilZ domain-containing protein [Psychromonas sp.]|uniref:PilZ domain-containing protein n=1 Tax=Psychromonas sp. TaxID=1884585 RepID=UPI00356709DF
MIEKREFPRVQHGGFCILAREESTEIETWQCSIINISAHGALIECPDNWPGAKNDNVRMTLTLDGDKIDIKMSGIIAHQHPGVLGVEFITLNLDSLAHLEKIIALNIAKETLLDKQA